jgi:DEAD/DEAH box helicase domain-containing protein
VRVYRAGLTPTEREEIEAGLRNRTVRAVFSTSALELGIDIGALDVVVCVGLPHTMMSLYQRAGRAGRGDREGAVVLIPGETPIDAYHAAHPRDLFARDHEPLVLNLSNQRVLNHHYACAAKEAGDESRLDLVALGSAMASVKAERDAGALRDEVFYLSQPHHSVRIRGSGDDAYQLRCDGSDVGEIDAYHLLREAPRNGIYFHGGARYRVQDVIAGNKQVRLAREFTHNTTTSTIGTSIRDRRLSAIRQTGRVVVARAVIDVNDYLISVTEKNPAGTTVRVHNGSGGMPNNWLPTEGTMLRLEQPLWNEIAGRLGDGPARAALEATARLFESLFPTVTGPCDRSDFSAAASFPKNGPVALYLYDSTPYGVGLTVGAYDRIGELVDRAAEQVRRCTCTADEGCFRCVRNPHAEQQASKANTLALLQIISQELRVPPVTLPPPVDQPPAPGTGQQTAQAKPCPTCGKPQPFTNKFCGNCGSKLEASS